MVRSCKSAPFAFHVHGRLQQAAASSALERVSEIMASLAHKVEQVGVTRLRLAQLLQQAQRLLHLPTAQQCQRLVLWEVLGRGERLCPMASPPCRVQGPSHSRQTYF